MVSADVDTDEALDALEFPVDAMVACAAVRTALFEAALAASVAAVATELDGASDKTLAFIEGADHFMRAGGTKANLGDPRPRLMKVLTDWTRDRFALS